MTKILSQTEKIDDLITPPIRKKRNFVPDVKAAIATTSSSAGLTVKLARRAFQAVCEVFTKDKYYLTAHEVPDYATSTVTP